MTQHRGIHRLVFVVLCMFVVALVASIRVHAEERTLVVPYDAACPFFCFDDPERPGLTIETIQSVFKMPGVHIESREVPYARAKLLWKEPNVLAVGLSEELAGCVRSSESLGGEPVGFFMSDKLNWKYDGVESLLSYRLGYVLGVQYTPDLDTYIAQHEDSAYVVGVAGDNAEKKLFQLLQMNRVDLFLTAYNMGVFQMQQLGIKWVKAELVPNSEQLFYVALCGDTPDKEKLISQFDQGMRAFWGSDVLFELEEKYNMEHMDRPDVK